MEKGITEYIYISLSLPSPRRKTSIFGIRCPTNFNPLILDNRFSTRCIRKLTLHRVPAGNKTFLEDSRGQKLEENGN